MLHVLQIHKVFIIPHQQKLLKSCISKSIAFGVNTKLLRLNSLSTGALDGIVVLHCRNSFFMIGNLSRQSSFLALPK